jgi:hypothetical protein
MLDPIPGPREWKTWMTFVFKMLPVQEKSELMQNNHNDNVVSFQSRVLVFW